MSTKVYIVTSGSYSDYSVRRIFASRALANAYIAARAGRDWYDDWNDVEEWDVTEAVPDIVPVWHGSAYVTKDGEIRQAARSWVWSGIDADSDRVPRRVQATTRDADFGHAIQVAGEGAVQVQVSARTEAAAHKALMDRAYRVSAERKGVVA